MLPFSGRASSFVSFSIYLLAGMPSVVFGIIGFVLFCQVLGFGWSILSASLTLALMLVPLLVTGFVQILRPMQSYYGPLVQSLGIRRLAFLFVQVPKYRARSLLATLQLSWSRALADTAAVMLTCGVVLEMPQSVYDSVRVLSYHIYLLAMDEPGGMPEARTLSLLLIVGLIALNIVAQRIGREALKRDLSWSPTAAS
jgi:phosphate transport system permease protein